MKARQTGLALKAICRHSTTKTVKSNLKIKTYKVK